MCLLRRKVELFQNSQGKDSSDSFYDSPAYCEIILNIMRCTPEDKAKDGMAVPLVQQLTNDFTTWLYTAIAQQISLTLVETTVMKVNFLCNSSEHCRKQTVLWQEICGSGILAWHKEVQAGEKRSIISE